MLKQITSIFIASLGLLFLTVTVFAQSGITFPIAELENCTNATSCKTFCDNSKNHQSCTDFAKKHNLSDSSSSDEEILKLARVELGCSSYDSCMQFCEEENNMETCMDFAARHNLMQDAPQMKQQMSALKNLLGCNSMKACMDFCNSPANMQKCMEVFKQAGFSVEASYSGPGGCNSEQSCQAYCEKNPKECGGDNFQSEPPEVWCSKVASDCKWDGATCTCGGDTSPPESGYIQEPPEVWCPKAGENCSWDGTQCNCFNTSEGQSFENTEDFARECQIQSGCSWDAATKICSCETGQTALPSTSGPGDAAYECQKLGGSWDGIDCRSSSPQVQGVKTNRGLLQQLLDFLTNRGL